MRNSTGALGALRRRTCVRKRLAFTANRKSSGTASRHFVKAVAFGVR
jgi:hypothetical protein